MFLQSAKTKSAQSLNVVVKIPLVVPTGHRGERVVASMTVDSNRSNCLQLCSSRPGRPPKRASVSLSLAASHLAATAAGHHAQQLKKHRLDNGDYYENGHLGEYLTVYAFFSLPSLSPSFLFYVCAHVIICRKNVLPFS